MHTVKRASVRFCLPALTALCLISSSSLSSQEVSQSNESGDGDEPLVLSPFVVEADADEGYRATSTLAGTRVRTDLKDTAAAISVVTRQFLSDTGVTNSQELLVYTPSTEVGGLGGNFSGFAGIKTPSESSGKPGSGIINSSNRVRGLDSADNTRDFFLTDIPWDSYNTGRVDLQRGPNSILFGVGSPAGIINASINDASFRRSYRGELIVDQWGSVRGSVDANHVLIKDQLALRLGYLDDRRKFEQEPAFNDQKRLYLAMRYDPNLFGKDHHTALRVKYENGDVDSNNPRSLPPIDRITPWFDSYFNKATVDTFKIGSHSISTTDPILNRYKPGNNFSVISNAASGVDIRSIYNGASASGVIPGESNVPTNVIVGMLNSGVGGAQNSQQYRPFAVPTYSLYARGVNLPGSSYYLDKVLTDPSVFDFFTKLLDGENKHEWQRWDAANIDLQQTFFKDRLAFDFTYDKQDYTQGQIGWLTGSDYAIGVDVNQKMVDGSANPNVGRPYVAGADSYGNFSQDSNRVGKRGIVTLDLKAEDYLGKGLLSRIIGRNVFTGLVAEETRDTQTTYWSQNALRPDIVTGMLGQGDSAIQSLIGTRQFDWQYYLGGSMSAASSASGANLTNIGVSLRPIDGSARYFNMTWNDPVGVQKSDPWTFIDAIDGSTKVGTQDQNPANYIGWSAGGINWLRAENPQDYPNLVYSGEKASFKDSSRGFTWQGYLFGGTLIPTFGWREDRVVNYAAAAPKNSSSGIAATDYPLDPKTYRLAEGQSRSWSGVFHLPQKLTSRLPWGTEISLLYNDSSNFKADAPRRNLLGLLIENPQADTKEKGIVVSTFDDRLTLKANWFDTKMRNATLTTSSTSFNMYRLASLGYTQAAMVQDYLNGVSTGPTNDFIMQVALNSWVNYAYTDGVAGVGIMDNLKNTSTTSPFQTAQQTKDSVAMVNAWLNDLPDFMTKDFYTYWGVPIAFDPAKARASGNLRDAFGGQDPYSDFLNGVTQVFSYISSQAPVTTVDTRSKGQEFELTYRPVRNWNITLNYVRTKATRTNIDTATVAYMNALNTFYNGPAGKLRLYGQSSPTFLVSSQWNQDVYAPYLVQLASQGQSAPEVSPWRFNLVSTYEVRSGKFKNLRIGGAARLEAGRISGYRYSSTLGYLDVTQPRIGPDDQHFDLWVGYSKKLKSDNLLWRVQLNVRNVGEKTRLVPSYYEPDGTLALARIQDGMSWRLTNSIEF